MAHPVLQSPTRGRGHRVATAVLAILLMLQFYTLLVKVEELGELREAGDPVLLSRAKGVRGASAGPPAAHATEDDGNRGGRIPSERTRLRYERGRNATKAAGRLEHRGVAGLGHRLARLSDAYHVARITHTPHLWASWGWDCGKDERGRPDIFEHLFGVGPLVVPPPSGGETASPPGPLYEPHLRKRSSYLKNKERIVNDVPHYQLLYTCSRSSLRKDHILDKALSDNEFYHQLRALFLFNNRVRSFAKEHRFSERIVLGIHVRAGNGETGEFQIKKRGFKNMDRWVVNTAQTIHRLAVAIRSAYDEETQRQKHLSPLLFIATDDASVVNKLANATRAYDISSVTFPQRTMERGAGVSFKHKWNNDTACHEDWVNQFIDATLLGAADVVIAGKYSSFTQTLPMMTVLAASVTAAPANATPRAGDSKSMSSKSMRNDGRFSHRLFCEVLGDGDAMNCYDDFIDWIYTKNPLQLPSLSRTVLVPAHHKEVRMLSPC